MKTKQSKYQRRTLQTVTEYEGQVPKGKPIVQPGQALNPHHGIKARLRGEAINKKLGSFLEMGEDVPNIAMMSKLEKLELAYELQKKKEAAYQKLQEAAEKQIKEQQKIDNKVDETNNGE